MRFSIYGLMAALGIGLLASNAFAQPTYEATVSCSATPTGHIEWPADDPVWSFDFIRPQNSSGNDGSGLELRDVYYKGRLVFSRAHVPIVNVEYDGSGCSCFRDWTDQEVGFAATGIRTGSESCFADATAGSVVTTCELPEGGDAGSFRGVAAEEFEGPGDVRELVLTSHMSAGWYRYRIKWHFYSDGRVWPEFSFAAASATCTSQAHRHHVYWRFDFDIDGADGDVIREVNPTAGTETALTTEAARTWGNPADGIYWEVVDTASSFGFEIVPSAADLALPVDPFSRLDAAVARYNPTEINDGATSLGQCPISLDGGYNGTTPILNGESTENEDIVFWYRSGALHTGGSPWECDIVGPTLVPFGVTNPGTNKPGTDEMPDGYRLERAYPNPFNPTTTVRFKVAQAQEVTLALYDALGRRVAELFSGYAEANRYATVQVDGSALPSGTYTVRLEGETVHGATRVVLVK